MTKLRLLYIEDKDIFVQIAKDALPDYEVIPATTLEKALAMLDTGEEFDGALVDLNMTDEGEQEGFEVLEYIMEHRPDLPRIVVTTLSNVSGSLMSNIVEKYGVDDILLKGPKHLPNLRAAVAKLFSGESRGTKTAREREARSRKGLTKRELEVLKLVAEGNSNKEIAEQLKFGDRAAEGHVRNMAAKLGLTTENGKKVRVALTNYARDHGLI